MAQDISLGRIQGAGFWTGTPSASNPSIYTITTPSTIAPMVGDIVVRTDGRVSPITAVSEVASGSVQATLSDEILFTIKGAAGSQIHTYDVVYEVDHDTMVMTETEYKNGLANNDIASFRFNTGDVVIVKNIPFSAFPQSLKQTSFLLESSSIGAEGMPQGEITIFTIYNRGSENIHVSPSAY